MAAELRWILLALSVPLLAAIWWWTARRSGQSPGNPELRESTPPLDENNVGRFCDIVRDMSRNVQFIFITHNKSTMELASQLVGVTMNEPGVSRLVAVDVDEAVRMAAM